VLPKLLVFELDGKGKLPVPNPDTPATVAAGR
jgi:hypothetical protein